MVADTISPESVERNLQALLDEHGLSKKGTLDMVKEWIWDDADQPGMAAINKYEKKFLILFKRVRDSSELNRVTQILIDAWNFFPHRSLGGKSPNQMAKQALKDNPALRKPAAQDMPDIVVGGERMGWTEYEAMITEMERRQVPFKRWIEQDVLPKYSMYLQQRYAKRTAERHAMVADVFFDRLVHVGFLELDGIRAAFIQHEFPEWWQTHVLISDLTPRQVVGSLKRLFSFLSLLYNTDMQKFGF